MSKEQEGEVATTQKRRKYELLGEDWGEIPIAQKTPQEEQHTSLPIHGEEEEEQDPHIPSHREHSVMGS